MPNMMEEAKQRQDGYDQMRFMRYFVTTSISVSVSNRLICHQVIMKAQMYYFSQQTCYCSCYYPTVFFCVIGGTIVLFDRKMLRNFRKDGHNWKKKKDGKTVKEAHEHLKVSFDFSLLSIVSLFQILIMYFIFLLIVVSCMKYELVTRAFISLGNLTLSFCGSH